MTTYRPLILRGVGLLLLVAAGLKVYGLAVEPVGPSGIFSSPWFQAALVQAECLLGLWLLSGLHARTAWRVTLATFACFAAFSLYQGWVGQTSCGCFGALRVNPWVAFALDGFVITALILARPPQTKPLPAAEARPTLSMLHTGLPVLATATALIAGLSAVATFWYGSPAAALASLRGERLSVSPSLVDFGEAIGGETQEASIMLTNRTDARIRVVGGTSDCACTVLQDLPLTIPPGETEAVTVRGRIPADAGQFTRNVRLLAGHDQLWKVGFVATGRSTGRPDMHTAGR